MLCLSVEVRGRVLLVSGVRGSVGVTWFWVAAVFALRAGRAHWVGPVVEIIYSWGFRLFEIKGGRVLLENGTRLGLAVLPPLPFSGFKRLRFLRCGQNRIGLVLDRKQQSRRPEKQGHVR